MSSNTLSTTPFFTPTSISGCTQWLDATDPNGNGVLPSNTSSVISWKDKSGNNYHVNQNAALAVPVFRIGLATNGSPGMDFTGGAGLVSPTSFAKSLNVTMLLVGMVRSTIAGWGTFWGHFPNGDHDLNAIQLRNTSGQAVINWHTNNNNSTSQLPYILNSMVLYSCTMTSGNQMFLQQTNVGGTTSLNVTNGAVTINTNAAPIWVGRSDLTGEAINSYIFEIVYYQSVLSTSDRQQIEGYLAWKWGLQSNLPSSHPYRYAPQGIYQIPPNIRPTAAIPIGANGQSFFNPTSIAGCALWFDAADPNGNGVVPANGAAVTTWVNKGTGSITLSNPSTMPTYMANFQNRLGSISFNNSYFQGSYSFDLSAKSAFLICSQSNNAVDSPQGFLSFYGAGNDTVNSTNGYGYQASQEGVGSFGWLYNIFQGGAAGYYIAQGTAGALTPLAMYENVFSNQFEQTFVNGASHSNFTITTSPGTATTVRIGARIIGGTLRGVLYGNICEIIVFSRGIVSSERQQVEGYLAWKWGLQANLPVSHPFRRLRPGLPAPIPVLPQAIQLNASAFSPLSVSGCSVWLDAADGSTISLSGTAVTQWRDKSGNGKNATTNSSVGPNYTQTVLNNSPSLYFDGTNFMSFANGTLTGPNGTFFVVAREDAGQTGQCFLMQNFQAFGIQEFQFDATGVTLFYPPWQPSALWASRITSWSLLGAEIIKTTGRLNTYTNGSLTTNASIGVSSTSGDSADGTNIGRYTVNGSEVVVLRYRGYISEIIYYNNVIPTTFQRQQVEGYLAWKWGLVANLPGNHPYKKWPPPP
jgi:hypothetical protein